ncbi:MAG: hypothetical protein ACRDKV_00245 [Solirubrobacterales bacterium]
MAQSARPLCELGLAANPPQLIFRLLSVTVIAPGGVFSDEEETP